MSRNELAERLRAARRAANLTQAEVAQQLGVHVMSVSQWERGVNIPEEPRLAKLAELYGADPASLRYGATRAGRERTTYTPNPSLRRRLPLRAYERVLDYIHQLEAAGVSEEQIDEAERLMIDGAFNKLNKRDVRQRSEDELITDIDAAWDFITFVLRREGFPL